MSSYTMDDRSGRTKFYEAWESPRLRPTFATGVSLHGHTWNSHENLNFLPGAIKKTYVLPALMRMLERRYHERWKDELDYNRGYWTSPISPETAYFIESNQINNEGLRPIVSITDHDEIAACEGREVVSLEWTAPYHQAVFHVGIHNLPKQHVKATLERLHAITEHGLKNTKDADPRQVREELEKIAIHPESLIVLNHPFVDQGRIGHAMHESFVLEFLKHHRDVIHALEINGLQPHHTNERVLALSNEFSLPLISGGDRHGFEPNGAINLTDAKTFNEFTREIRNDKCSTILFMPQYRERLAWRYTRNIQAIMGEYPVLGARATWHDRVFYKCPDGVVRSITEMTAGKKSSMVKTTNGLVSILSLVNYLTRTVSTTRSDRAARK